MMKNQVNYFLIKNFPWLSSKNIELDMIPILAIRVAYIPANWVGNLQLSCRISK